MIKLIVGLGNPGPEYEATRHNAGFWFVDAVARAHRGELRREAKFSAAVARVSVGRQACILAEPLTFMNASGRAVAAVARYYGVAPDAILVAHDELDLPAGTVRLKVGGGHGGHNGLRDITAALGTDGYARLRLGIGRPPSGGDVTGWVLSRPGKDERAQIDGAIERALALAPDILGGDLQAAMNALHRAG